MPFPTTSTRDTFTSALVQSLHVYSASWQEVAPASHTGDLETDGSGRARSGGSIPALNAWVADGMLADQEAFVDVPVLSTGGDRSQGVALRLKDLSTSSVTFDGYAVFIAVSTIYVLRWIDGAYTFLTTFPGVTFVAGDGIGASMIGTTIRAYHRSGGVWAEVGSISDATHASGYPGVYTSDNAGTGRLDNFGGGALVAVVTASFDFVSVF